MDKVTNDAHSHAHNHHHAHAHGPSDTTAGASAVDPVCGMTVDPHKTQHRHAYHDHTYYFCSNGCRTKFGADPEKYLDKKAVAAEVPPGTIYTCPMHPQIRQVGPGSCPICGMALEPLEPTAETGPNPELADMTRRLWIGLAPAIPVVLLEMGSHLLDLHMVPPATSNWIQLVLATGNPWSPAISTCSP
jgi:Cu+-exporting ATPase